MPFFQTKNLCPACGENLKKNPPTPIKAAWYKYVKTPGFSCNSCQARLRTRFGQGEFLLPLVVGIPTLRLPYWKFVALFLALWLAGHAIALLFVSKYVELK